MITLIISIVLLLIGYFFYGRLMDKVFGIDDKRKTPAYQFQDNMDYVPMSTGKAYLIQFLDIAGLGPIFGAILGATYGPIAFIWIVIGSILGGAVHDYFSGMMSVRQRGESIAEIIGRFLGLSAKQFMRVFTVFLMILVGAAFIMGPAKILATMVGAIRISETLHIGTNQILWFWLVLIIGYYFLATLLPIDKIIGRIYPFFGIMLLFMALGIGLMLFINGTAIPELTWDNLRNMKSNAQEAPIFPLIFITISCGAISGFHSTQSPLMARTIKNENKGRQVFYGAMITEALVALIWAAAAMSFFGGVDELNRYITKEGGNPAVFVSQISTQWLGLAGGIMAVIGVVAAPITTGDTALRSARLIIADFTKLKQDSIRNRLIITIPIFIITISLTFMNFEALWRLMFWFNQVLAAIVLWGITVYLAKKRKAFVFALIPAVFMTSVVTSYLFIAKETLNMSHNISYILGISISAMLTLFFFYKYFRSIRHQEKYTD